jgi:hypothetical protein
MGVVVRRCRRVRVALPGSGRARHTRTLVLGALAGNAFMATGGGILTGDVPNPVQQPPRASTTPDPPDATVSSNSSGGGAYQGDAARTGQGEVGRRAHGQGGRRGAQEVR